MTNNNKIKEPTTYPELLAKEVYEEIRSLKFILFILVILFIVGQIIIYFEK